MIMVSRSFFFIEVEAHEQEKSKSLPAKRNPLNRRFNSVLKDKRKRSRKRPKMQPKNPQTQGKRLVLGKNLIQVKNPIEQN